jgi:hypothetical protein
MPSSSAAPKPAPIAKPPEPPPYAAGRHKVALTLKPGDAPCTLVWDGKVFEDHPEWFTITSVTRIATEDGGACASAVFYDLLKETKRNPDDMDPMELVAGIFEKPGQKLPADVDTSTWNVTEDLDFDDVADLCVVVMTGAYNYSQKCWLFDTKSRTFVRNEELDELIFMTVDRKKQILKNAFRAGGPVYENNEYKWQKGKLVNTYKAVSYFMEKPDGGPLPPGFGHWLTRYELRNGKLVKTFDGALRESP